MLPFTPLWIANSIEQLHCLFQKSRIVHKRCHAYKQSPPQKILGRQGLAESIDSLFHLLQVGIIRMKQKLVQQLGLLRLHLIVKRHKVISAFLRSQPIRQLSACLFFQYLRLLLTQNPFLIALLQS